MNTEWDKIDAWIKTQIPNYEVKNKGDSSFQKFIGKISFWMDYMNVWTTMYPNVWLPDRSGKENPNVLQHEAVHLLDMKTFFGLMPWMPAKFNATLFHLLFVMPQALSILSIFAIWNPWWFLCLLLLAPLPSPVRMYGEMRAYRRSIEIGSNKDSIIKSMNGWTYYKMWPFKKHLEKMLDKPSPYKEEMDKILAE
jgi:hypothetical protein